MLILTRSRGESIRIGDEITVKVLKIRPGYVLIGIEAPTAVRVLREEIFDRGPVTHPVAAAAGLGRRRR